MNTEGKFYTAFWSLASIVAVVLILSVLSASNETKRTMAVMVEAGYDPIAAKCALDGRNEGTRTMCMKYIETMK